MALICVDYQYYQQMGHCLLQKTSKPGLLYCVLCERSPFSDLRTGLAVRCLIWWDDHTYDVSCVRSTEPKTAVFRVRNQLEQINNKSCLGLDGLNGYSEVGNSLADVLNYVLGPHTSLSRWCEWNNKRVSSNLMINGSLLYKYK